MNLRLYFAAARRVVRFVLRWRQARAAARPPASDAYLTSLESAVAGVIDTVAALDVDDQARRKLRRAGADLLAAVEQRIADEAQR